MRAPKISYPAIQTLSPQRTRSGARTRYRRSRPLADSAPKRRLPPRMATPTPCRRRRRKTKNEEKRIGDRCEVTVRNPLSPTLTLSEHPPIGAFYTHLLFLSCLSSASSASSAVRASAFHLPGKGNELIELGLRGAGGDGIKRLLHARFVPVRNTGCIDCCAGIERHDVARRAGLVRQRPNEHVPGLAAVLD